MLLAVSCGGCERKPSSAAETLPARRQQDTGQRSTAVDASAASAKGLRVMFLGDSITAGYGLASDYAYPALLARELQRENVTIRATNAGVSGDTSAGGLRRVSWLLKQRPEIVVVELGGNDGLRGLPVAALEQNLRALIELIQRSGAKVLLLGMRMPPNYGVAYAREFEAVYPRVARELGVAFVPFFMEGVAGVAELNQPDGLHPTRAGHERLARNVMGPLSALIAQHAPADARK
jgi:acyl-CoA thioesterase I